MKPLFIWAGGKNKMLKHYKPFMPSEVKTYLKKNAKIEFAKRERKKEIQIQTKNLM